MKIMKEFNINQSNVTSKENAHWKVTHPYNSISSLEDDNDVKIKPTLYCDVFKYKLKTLSFTFKLKSSMI